MRATRDNPALGLRAGDALILSGPSPCLIRRLSDADTATLLAMAGRDEPATFPFLAALGSGPGGAA